MEPKAQPTSDPEVRARAHAIFCLQCAAVVVRYRDRIRRPWSTVPEEVASEIRAQLCKEGAALVDAVLTGGVR